MIDRLAFWWLRAELHALWVERKNLIQALAHAREYAGGLREPLRPTLPGERYVDARELIEPGALEAEHARLRAARGGAA